MIKHETAIAALQNEAERQRREIAAAASEYLILTAPVDRTVYRVRHFFDDHPILTALGMTAGTLVTAGTVVRLAGTASKVLQGGIALLGVVRMLRGS
ncbi:hypothetical protein ACFPL7_17630 [Dongia soli]|uniref:Uncharacterized protein n=1 Tax=Dongia soli TaxID=600628 RepID=A0ABU5E534_9PROT|nr:hypothetical protein [Dongia soli]MDY0881413.1 hypothetical protein [Dongia soli]